MSTLENVLGTACGAYAVRIGYGPWGGSGAGGDDRGAAIIRELTRGNIAGIRQTVAAANTAVSMVQKFGSAAGAIGEKLARMEQLAQEAATGYHTAGEKADMQQQFQSLAGQINLIVQNTEHEGNKLFTSSGETIAIALGNGTTIHIFPRDLSFDGTGLDLTADAAGAYAQLCSARANHQEFSQYLSSRRQRLGEALSAVERDFGEALGVDVGEFDVGLAKDIVSQIGHNSSESAWELLETQANVSAAQAGWLLEYTAADTRDITE
jgi:flagellin-like hook-associated protein FlgL